MSATLEDRVKTLEQRLEELSGLVRAGSPALKGWRSTFGLSKDDPDFDEMNRLGREYRNSENGDGRS